MSEVRKEMRGQDMQTGEVMWRKLTAIRVQEDQQKLIKGVWNVPLHLLKVTNKG